MKAAVIASLFLLSATSTNAQIGGSEASAPLNFKGLEIGMPLEEALALRNPDLAQLRELESGCRVSRAYYCTDLRASLRRKRDENLIAAFTTYGGDQRYGFSPSFALVGDYIVNPQLTFDCASAGCPLVEIEFSAASKFPASPALLELLRARYGPISPAAPLVVGDTAFSYSALVVRSVSSTPTEYFKMESVSYRARLANSENNRRQGEIERQKNF